MSSLEAQRSRERAQLIEATNIRESAAIDLRRLIGVAARTRSSSSPTRSRLDGSAITCLQPAQVSDVGQAGARGAARTEGADVSDGRRGSTAAGRADGDETDRRVRPAASTTPSRTGRFSRCTKTWEESWDVGVNVNWNFFDFGRAKSQAAEAAAIVTATRERIAEFDSVVSADIRQRLLDLESSQAMVRAASDAVRSAAEARRVVSDRFGAGVATSTDVLVAQVALLEAELVRTRALAGVRLAEARLERALGSSREP